MFSKTRLAAFMAVLLVGLVAVVVAGCGGGGSSSSSETTASEEPAETNGGGAAGEESEGEEEPAGGGEKLTVGSDIPYPPFEQGKAGSYTGFDVNHPALRGKLLPGYNSAKGGSDVTDRDGQTPNRFQPAYLDPIGRSIRIGVRKLF